MLADIWSKVKGQTLKDYVLFPVLSGPSLPFVLAGNATANLTRNLWAFTIIFCGHFPDGTRQFTEPETENETRGEWYYRQLLGSANLTGGEMFHILAGNLSFQIEHHLFPDLPAHRYKDISKDVREITGRYGIPYNTGPLHRQFGSVVRKIAKLAVPPRQWLGAQLGGVASVIIRPALSLRSRPAPAAGDEAPAINSPKQKLASAA
jgi:fatty acid desaturase